MKLYDLFDESTITSTAEVDTACVEYLRYVLLKDYACVINVN